MSATSPLEKLSSDGALQRVHMKFQQQHAPPRAKGATIEIYCKTQDKAHAWRTSARDVPREQFAKNLSHAEQPTWRKIHPFWGVPKRGGATVWPWRSPKSYNVLDHFGRLGDTVMSPSRFGCLDPSDHAYTRLPLSWWPKAERNNGLALEERKTLITAFVWGEKERTRSIKCMFFDIRGYIIE